jgi:UDP-2,3-diacylglucosamine pyrophosphatase LpxH
LRTVVIGDVHLGSPLCRAGRLLELLTHVPFDRLVLNGDIFDDLNFRRLNDKHWKVLERLRELSQERQIVWVFGNHDGSPEALKRLLGVTVSSDYRFTFRGRLVYVIHGDAFDEFQHATKKFKGLRSLRNTFYGFAIWFDVPRKTAIQWFQRSATIFARAAEQVRQRAIERGRSLGARYVVVGHTHHREVLRGEEVTFFNPSSWLTPRPAYVLFDDRLEEPRLVVMGGAAHGTLRRAVRAQVQKARRRIGGDALA